MMPDRPQLAGWDVGSLLANGTALGNDGIKFGDIGFDLCKSITTLGDNHHWTGAAHDATLSAFQRIMSSGQDIGDFVWDWADELQIRYYALSAAKSKVENMCADIERDGKLTVLAKWGVVVKVADMSAEQYSAAKKLADQKQSELNDILPLVSQADSADGFKKVAESINQYFAPLMVSDTGGLYKNGVDPMDNAPNPSTPSGKLQQDSIRSQYASTAVRSRQTSEASETDKNGLTWPGTQTTLTMQDGSKQVITDWRKNAGYTDVTANTYDPSGHLIAKWQSWSTPYGDKHTLASYKLTDGQVTDKSIIFSATEDHGRRSGILMANGKELDIPSNSDAWTKIIDQGSLIGSAGIAGSETYLDKTSKIPFLSEASTARLGAAANYAGPALAAATTLYDVIAADSGREACVAINTNAGAIVGGMVGEAAGGENPILAAIGMFGLGYAGGKLGEAYGEVACGPEE